MAKPLDIKSKGAEGPVTNVDIAVNDFLMERLRGQRPAYGWLSEETPDDPDQRVNALRAFIVDPIDGTAAMIARVPQFTISIGVVERGRAVAGAVYNPLTDELFLGAVGAGATLNGRAVQTTARDKLEGARLIGQKFRLNDKRWTTPWPKVDIVDRQSIAYRLALISAGQGDATLLFGFKNEWDVAAGAALVEAAGGQVSDFSGDALTFNQPKPHSPGVVAAGAALHALLIERTSAWPDPRDKSEQP
jgi:myo-inositol-1(or 4)-monophosphatase